MEQYKKLTLNNATPLSHTEMKMVIGGYNGAKCPPLTDEDPNYLIPSSAGCEYYIVCDHTGPVRIGQCHNALHFNPNLQVCDHPDKAGCK